jgi:hypothetical protein
MSPEARALAKALLDHHREVIRRHGEASPDSCLISYGVLCDTAGLAYLSPNPGPLLREIAEWCHNNGWPPINSLAVHYKSRQPGEGYDKAPGCSLLNWPKELDACIRFRGYPDTLRMKRSRISSEATAKAIPQRGGSANPLARLGFTRFDYLSCGFGIAATVFVIMYRHRAGALLYFVEVFATLICVLVGASFMINIVTRYLSRSELVIYLSHIACNLIPAVHLLHRFKQTPWDRIAGP